MNIHDERIRNVFQLSLKLHPNENVPFKYSHGNLKSTQRSFPSSSAAH